MNKTTKKILLNYILLPALLVLLLWLIYRQIGQGDAFEQQWADFKTNWRNGNKYLLFLVLLLAPLNWMMEAVKWQMLLKKIQPLPFLRAFASTLTGIAFALVTPNKIGDFAGRVLYLENKNRLRAVIATLVGNLAQTLVTFVFGIVGLVYFNIYHPGSWQLLTLIGALAALSLLVYLYLNIDKIADKAEGKQWLRKIIISIRILKRYSREDLIRLLLVSLVRFCIYNLQFLILANVCGAGVPWIPGFLVSGLMFWMITVIPSIFLADLGVRGFVAGLLFTQTGIATNGVAILAGSYIIWILNLVIPAIIGSILILSVKLVK